MDALKGGPGRGSLHSIPSARCIRQSQASSPDCLPLPPEFLSAPPRPAPGARRAFVRAATAKDFIETLWTRCGRPLWRGGGLKGGAPASGGTRRGSVQLPGAARGGTTDSKAAAVSSGATWGVCSVARWRRGARGAFDSLTAALPLVSGGGPEPTAAPTTCPTTPGCRRRGARETGERGGHGRKSPPLLIACIGRSAEPRRPRRTPATAVLMTNETRKDVN